MANSLGHYSQSRFLVRPPLLPPLQVWLIVYCPVARLDFTAALSTATQCYAPTHR